MGTEIANLQSLGDRVTDKIKTEFASLIPDEAWAQMTAKVIETFYKAPQRDRCGHIQSELSPLEQLIKDYITEQAKAKIRAEVDKLLATEWKQEEGGMVRLMLDEMIAKAAPTLFESVIKGITSSVVTNALYQMKNQM